MERSSNRPERIQGRSFQQQEEETSRAKEDSHKGAVAQESERKQQQEDTSSAKEDCHKGAVAQESDVLVIA